MKKKHMLKALRKARASGCSCITREPREVCAACFASDLLGLLPPGRRIGFVQKVTSMFRREFRSRESEMDFVGGHESDLVGRRSERDFVGGLEGDFMDKKAGE